MIRISDLPKRFCANKGRSSYSALAQQQQQQQQRGALSLARRPLQQHARPPLVRLLQPTTAAG
jgi:hypothetical protein